MSTSPISFFALKLDLFRNKMRIGTGTGFIYYCKNDFYLITNYHVVTCREPKNPEFLLPNYPDSPDRIEFTLTKSDDFSGRTIGIDINNNAHFLEHPKRNEGVDIVALKIIFNDAQKEYITTQIQLNLVDDIEVEITSNLFIVGYPWGESAIPRLPIWKKGTVASEPGIHYNMQGFFIDSFTHPGMSGSPVFACENRAMLMVSNKTYEIYNDKNLSALEKITKMDPDDLSKNKIIKHFRFVGIYSGRLTFGVNDPQLGIVWPVKLIEEIFEYGILATNPYPPYTAI